MRKHFNGRPRQRVFNSVAPGEASYHQGPIYTNGALEFVYEKPVAWPLYTLWGIGILTRQQFDILQPQQLESDLALTVAPIYGPGTPAGSIELQGLIEDQELNAMLGLTA